MRPDLLADGHSLRDQVRRTLADWQLAGLPQVQGSATGYDVQVWTSLLRRVWPAVTTSDEVRVLAEELGRLRCPTPIHSGLAPVDWLLRCLPGEGASLRADLTAGVRFAAALDAAVHGQRETDGSWRLSGDLRHITYGDSTETFLVPVHVGRSMMLVAVLAQAAGVRRKTHDTLSCDRMTDVQLNDVAASPAAVLVPASSDAERAVQTARAVAVVARAAELTGLAAGLLTVTKRRVTTRQAFGQPLAAQQSVQHRAADMYLDLQAARDATRDAAHLLDANVASAGPKAALSTEVELALSTAHVTSTAAALRIAGGAHQLCGGWGQLDEAGLHPYTRAIKSAEAQLGSAAAHRATIVSLLVGRIPRD
jgi:hypothetical protein